MDWSASDLLDGYVNRQNRVDNEVEKVIITLENCVETRSGVEGN